VNMASGIVLMVAHAGSFRTKGDAVGIKSDALFIEEMGIDLLAVF